MSFWVITTYRPAVMGDFNITVSGTKAVTFLTLPNPPTTSTQQTTTTTTTTIRTVTSAYSASISDHSPIFTRVNSFGDFFYVAVRASIATSGTYTFRSSGAVDTFGCLYNSSFAPSSPNTNLIVLDDDSAGAGQFSLSATLVAKANVILVITTYRPAVMGDFNITVSGTKAVTFLTLPNPPTASTQQTTTTTTTTIRTVTSAYSASISDQSLIFTRVNSFGDFFYVAVRVSIATSGTYTFRSSGAVDTFGCLYNSSFAPSSPNTNLITLDDDSAGAGQFSLSATLVAKATVILVITTYRPAVTGNINITANGPTAATFSRMSTRMLTNGHGASSLGSSRHTKARE